MKGLYGFPIKFMLKFWETWFIYCFRYPKDKY